MSQSMQSLGIHQLPLNERIILWHEIGDSIVKETQEPLLNDELRAALEQRLDEDDANPDDVIPWEEMKTQYAARSRQS